MPDRSDKLWHAKSDLLTLQAGALVKIEHPSHHLCGWHGRWSPRTPICSVLFATKVDDVVRERGRGRLRRIAFSLLHLLALLNCEQLLVAKGCVEIVVTHARQQPLDLRHAGGVSPSGWLGGKAAQALAHRTRAVCRVRTSG